MVTACGCLALPLIVAAEALTSVRHLRCCIKRHERQLGDQEARPKLDRDAGEVVELKRESALPARVAEARRGMDDQAKAAEGTLALNAGNKVVGDLNPFEGARKAELAWLDDEGFTLAADEFVGQVLGWLSKINGCDLVVVEDSERVTEPQIHGSWLDLVGIPRVNDDLAFLNEAANRAI